MPGIGDEIDGAMQQAPQPERQFICRIHPTAAEWRSARGNPLVFEALFRGPAS
jgi:hypothetical protein